MVYHVKSVDETMGLGYKLGKLLNEGDVICLTGDLGTGKTHFVKGVAKGLSIIDEITSPTFTIVNVYDSGRILLNHFDVYRIKDIRELENIGFDDYIFSKNVSIIEWANFIEELIPEEFIHVHVKKIKLNDNPLDNDHREIKIIGYGERYNNIKENLR